MSPHRLGVACAWVLLLASPPGLAEPPPAPPDDVDARTTEPQSPDAPEVPSLEVTVRAARVPDGAAYRVNADTLAAAPRTNATDVLRLVPGLVVSQHSGEGKAHQLFLRGFDAMHGQDIEMDVGGLPVNGVSHIHALGYADLNFLIPETVQEIEVLEGSSRVDQGDFAVAGTARLRLGLAEPGWMLSTGFGQFGQQRLVAGWRPQGSPRSFAAAELTRGDGYGERRGYGRASALAQIDEALNDGLRLRALVGSYAARFGSPGVVPERDFDSGQMGFFDATDAQQGGYSDRHQALVELAWPRREGERTTLSAYAIRSTLRLRNDFTGYFVDQRGDGLQQSQTATTLGLSAAHERTLDVLPIPLDLHAGAGARHDDIDQAQRAYRTVDGTFIDSDRERAQRVQQSDLWAYGELTARLDRWRLRLGARGDAIAVRAIDALAFDNPRYADAPGYDRSAFGLHLGLKGGVSRQLGDNARVSLDYGEGFRTPQAFTLTDGEKAPFVKVRGGDLGLRWATRRAAAGASVFVSHLANDVFFDHSVGTTVYTGATLRSGLSWSAAASPLPGLHLATSGTLAHALVLKTQTLLPYFAPVVLRGDGSYEHPFDLGSERLVAGVGLGVTLVGPRPMRFGDFAQTYFLADSRLSLRWRVVEMRLEVKNLLDARWRDGEFDYPSHFRPGEEVSGLPRRHFTAGAPRTAWVAAVLHL